MTHRDLAQYIVETATGDHRVWIAATLVRRDGTTSVHGDWGDAERCPECDGWDVWLGCGAYEMLGALALPNGLADPICEALNDACDEGRCKATVPLDGALLVVQLAAPPEGTVTVAAGDDETP